MAEKNEKTRIIKAPVTMNDPATGAYVAPGTEITLSESEADDIDRRFGIYDGPGPVDPGNTNALNVDQASIAALNEHQRINGGTEKIAENKSADDLADLGEGGSSSGGAGGGTETAAQLEDKHTKPELEDMAEKIGATYPSGANKLDIAKAIVAKRKAG